MGGSSFSQKENTKKNSYTVNINSFEFFCMIGKGGFGKVWLVYSRKYKKEYAMKEMSKTKIIDKRSEKSIISERELLSKMNHPFIINMHFAFQDKDTLYLVMDLLTGGDLRYHISKKKTFTEEQSKFCLACLILSLEYCHCNKIIHRDVKPENLLLDDKGYFKLTDFGISKILPTGNCKETSGTIGYMSPEVMCALDHTVAVDAFAVGVIGFELVKGVRPYLGKSRKEIKERMMKHQAYINNLEIPIKWSIEGIDCINRMLQRKPVNRLGLRGAWEIKEHVWFRDFNWNDLYNKKMKSPFIPMKKINLNYRNFNEFEEIGLKTKERYIHIMERNDYNEVFKDYHYFNRFDMEIDKEIVAYNGYFFNPHCIYNDNNYKEVDYLIENTQRKHKDKKSVKVKPRSYSLLYQ